MIPGVIQPHCVLAGIVSCRRDPRTVGTRPRDPDGDTSQWRPVITNTAHQPDVRGR